MQLALISYNYVKKRQKKLNKIPTKPELLHIFNCDNNNLVIYYAVFVQTNF